MGKPGEDVGQPGLSDDAHIDKGSHVCFKRSKCPTLFNLPCIISPLEPCNIMSCHLFKSDKKRFMSTHRKLVDVILLNNLVHNISTIISESINSS